MKRSRMIEEIKNILEDDPGYSHWKMARAILSMIESNGMSPPGRWSSVLRGETAREETERVQWEQEE